MSRLWLQNLFENNISLPRWWIVWDGIATTETLVHTRAAPTPLQAVGDAASCTIGVSVQFGSTSQRELHCGSVYRTVASNNRPQGRKVNLLSCTDNRRFTNVKPHVTGVKTWTAMQWFGPIICCAERRGIQRAAVWHKYQHTATVTSLAAHCSSMGFGWGGEGQGAVCAVPCVFKLGFPKVWCEDQLEALRSLEELYSEKNEVWFQW